MPDDDRWKPGGYTRNCPDCGYQRAVEDLAAGAGADPATTAPSMRRDPEPCPECGYAPTDPGEKVYDWSTCAGCGSDVPASDPPVKGFPGQGYCSAAHAGLV